MYCRLRLSICAVGNVRCTLAVATPLLYYVLISLVQLVYIAYSLALSLRSLAYVVVRSNVNRNETTRRNGCSQLTRKVGPQR